MGKHKSKKHKNEKKKHKKREKRYSSSSSSTSEDEWIEKEVTSTLENDCKSKNNQEQKHEDWMQLSTGTSSYLYSKNRDDTPKKKNDDHIQYDPRQSSRELNPYWKKGGDGLPSTSFKKPSEDYDSMSQYKHQRKERGNWRVKKQEKEDSNKHHQIEDNKADNYKRKSSPDKYTKADLNKLGAQLLKAEIMGNQKLIEEFKSKMEEARKCESTADDNEIILTHTNEKGYSQPVRLNSDYNTPNSRGKKHKKQKIETHIDGQRTCYFPDDDKYSLQQMFEHEKNNTQEEQNKEYMKLIGNKSKNDDFDDIFVDKIRRKDTDATINSRNKDKAINEHQKISKSLDNCNRCLQGQTMSKHLMVSLGETIYLSLPHHEPLTEGHCLLIPIRHTPCATQLDENEWSELLDFRKALCKMFKTQDEDVIFFEYAIYLNKFPHMIIECVPLPKEQADLAPIYFKKAIDESETEWASNKKLVSLAGRDVRRAVPKGLPYFAVSFGMDEGYAHVIEDQQLFPNNFAQEIIGGMLDLHHSKWRKPKRQNFDEQSKRVVKFSEMWGKFDCTLNK